MSAKLFTATDTFTAGIASVLPSASTDLTCPPLCCVHITWTTDSVVFVATNRYTLAEHTFPRGDWPGDDEGSVSIPLSKLSLR